MRQSFSESDNKDGEHANEMLATANNVHQLASASKGTISNSAYGAFVWKFPDEVFKKVCFFKNRKIIWICFFGKLI